MRLSMLVLGTLATLPALRSPAMQRTLTRTPVLYVQVTPDGPADGALFQLVPARAPADTVRAGGGAVIRLTGASDDVVCIAAPGHRLRVVVTDSAGGSMTLPVEVVASVVSVHWTATGPDVRSQRELPSPR